MERFDQKIKHKISSIEYDMEPGEELMESMFNKLDDITVETPVIDLNEKLSSSGLVFRIAASILVALVAGFVAFQLNEVDQYIAKGAKEEHLLPDGSKVYVNADSRIAYNKLSWIISRSVSLEGEAFFEVEAGSTFTVSTPLGQTQVLGTSFNVYSRDADYRVECLSGKVRVTYTGVQLETILTPGKGTSFNKIEGVNEFEIDIDQRADWRQGEFYFDNESLKYVISTFSRQYGVEVRMSESLYEITYSGYFDDKNLDVALKLICDPLDLKYKIMGPYVVIE